jgi:hypothetical protein
MQHPKSFDLSGELDFSDCCLVNLCPVYKNENFSDDFVYSLCRAQEGLPFPVYNLFRIDSGWTEPVGKRDHVALRRSLHSFRLEEWSIAHNDRNEKCSITRQELLVTDLQRLILGNSYVSNANSKGKLFFQFLDTDDIIHPDLLRIEMTAALLTASSVVSCERCICQFSRYTIDRLERLNNKLDISNFASVQLDLTDKQLALTDDFYYNPDGTVSRGESTDPRGYVPVIFKLKEEIIAKIKDPTYFKKEYYLETMHRLLDQYGEDASLLIPISEASSLYFYRQHPDSALHSVEEMVYEGAIKDLIDNQKRMDIYADILVDCNIEILEEKLTDLQNKCSYLTETIQNVLRVAKAKRERLEEQARPYKELAERQATCEFRPGLKW